MEGNATVLPRWAPTPLLKTENAPILWSNQEADAIPKFQDASKNTSVEIEHAKTELGEVREILDRLRKWHGWEMQRRHSLRRFLLSKGISRRPPCPPQIELKRLATFFFPLRSLLKATICDIGDGRFNRIDVDIRHLQPYLGEKPTWATVRWIHVPVGLGLVHESIKHSFEGTPLEYGSRLVSYSNASSNAGSGLACEVISLRDRQYLQDQLDVFNILRDFTALTEALDVENKRHGWDSGIHEDIARTAKQYNIANDFWQLGTTDIPWQLGEGTRFSLLDTDLGTNTVSSAIEEQLLSLHPRYENAVLVRALFQCYHRIDGVVLTMSPTAGVSLLDRTILQEIKDKPSTRAANDKASFIGGLIDRCSSSGSGSKSWPTKSPEWFITLLYARLLVTPHSLPTGRTIPEIQNAYLPLVRDLKTRRGADFKRHESVNLVREYVSCMDEVSQIYSIAERKLDFLERLKKDCAENEGKGEFEKDLAGQSEDMKLVRPTADPRTRELMINKLNDATNHIKQNHESLPGTLNDLRNSLDDLFQLRTIEQNELAIIAESNNKAILVFTVVTIIFLPLSFFTSYFGMNFKGDYSLLSGQGYFWGLCGSITLVIVVFTLVYGFKDRLYGWIWGDRHPSVRQEYRRKRR